MHLYFSLIPPTHTKLVFVISDWQTSTPSEPIMFIYGLVGVGRDRGQGFRYLGHDLQADGLCLRPRAKVGHSPVRQGQEGPWESQLMEETAEQSALLSSPGR